MIKKCLHCNKEFNAIKNHGKFPKFCNMKCFKLFRKNNQPTTTCNICGKTFKTHPSRLKNNSSNPRKYCSKPCLYKSRLNNKYNWKGGVIITKNGYRKVYQPNHPHAHRNKVFEHRLVMEQHIGRILNSKERVHHIDRNKLNNNISNLILCSNESEHQKLYHQFAT